MEGYRRRPHAPIPLCPAHAQSTASMVRLPTLAKLRWRVDVAISTSALKRALKPAVLLEVTTSAGAIHTFEVPADKFHMLRYNVAYMLKVGPPRLLLFFTLWELFGVFVFIHQCFHSPGNGGSGEPARAAIVSPVFVLKGG